MSISPWNENPPHTLLHQPRLRSLLEVFLEKEGVGEFSFVSAVLLPDLPIAGARKSQRGISWTGSSPSFPKPT
jgi:hypothetical protein